MPATARVFHEPAGAQVYLKPIAGNRDWTRDADTQARRIGWKSWQVGSPGPRFLPRQTRDRI